MPPLSSQQLGYMNSIGTNSSGGGLSDDQLNAMMGMNLQPSQSAAALGHSNSLIQQNIGNAGQSLQKKPGETFGGDLMGIAQKAEDYLPTIGAVGGGILGAAGGTVLGAPTGPGAALTGYAGGVAGSGIGASAGEALKEKLQGQSLNPGEIAKQGGINAAFDAVGGPILSAAGKAIGKVSSPLISSLGGGLAKIGDLFGGSGGAQVAKTGADAVAHAPESLGLVDPTAVATNRLASTAQNMTKSEREQAILEGRMTPQGKYSPSETEQNAGEIMSGNTSHNPVKTLQAVQEEIANRGQTAEDYLTGNAVKISNKEDADAFAAARNSSEKYMTPAETNAYDEQIGVFQKVLKSYTSDGGYNTANYYKALKDYEEQVTANLPKGKEALLAPGGAARIQAAKDVRTVVRNMIGEKNPEFKGQMYDLASLYGARDNVVANAEQGGATFAKRHPLLTGVGAGLGGIAGYEEAKKIPIIGGLLP